MALFDTLKAAIRLQEEGGFNERQASAIVATTAEAVNDRLATKDDLHHLEEGLEHRLTIRMTKVAMTATGLLLAAIGVATGVLAST